MVKQSLSFTILTIFIIFYFISSSPTVIAQSPAPAPSPHGPAHIIIILKKAGHFNSFIRLLKKTKMEGRIFSLLNNSDPLTIFAPSDQAFSKMKTETLKKLSFQQRIQLVQFHVINRLLSESDFQTVSNPLSTQAGDNGKYSFPLNITTLESNQVNISTGIVNANVSGTVYSDDLLAVYEVDRVLLPLKFFVTPPPVPAPKVKPDREVPTSDDEEEDNDEDDDNKSSSGAILKNHPRGIWFLGSVMAAISWCF